MVASDEVTISNPSNATVHRRQNLHVSEELLKEIIDLGANFIDRNLLERYFTTYASVASNCYNSGLERGQYVCPECLSQSTCDHPYVKMYHFLSSVDITPLNAEVISDYRTIDLNDAVRSACSLMSLILSFGTILQHRADTRSDLPKLPWRSHDVGHLTHKLSTFMSLASDEIRQRDIHFPKITLTSYADDKTGRSKKRLCSRKRLILAIDTHTAEETLLEEYPTLNGIERMVFARSWNFRVHYSRHL